MKKTCMVVMALFLSLPPMAGAQEEFGRVRALEQRADTVVRQKNSFVARVLTAYKIPHTVNEQGVVVRIHVDEQWHDVTAIEIVPLLKAENGTIHQVAAHELYFFTEAGILDLVSELTIR